MTDYYRIMSTTALALEEEVAGMGRSRTLLTLASHINFEDCGSHRAPSTPVNGFRIANTGFLGSGQETAARYEESRLRVVSPEQYQDFQQEALVHTDALYRYARRLTNDAREGEDLLQETFLRALRFWHQYQKGTNCKAWLFRIMRNLSINRAQSKARSPVSDSLEDTEEWSLYGKLHDPESLKDDSPEKRFFEQNWSKEIVDAMAKLPEEYRSAIILCDVEGFAYQEIADILDIPIGTVRSRLNRARTRLQQMLLGYVQENHPDLLVKRDKDGAEKQNESP